MNRAVQLNAKSSRCLFQKIDTVQLFFNDLETEINKRYKSIPIKRINELKIKISEHTVYFTQNLFGDIYYLHIQTYNNDPLSPMAFTQLIYEDLYKKWYKYEAKNDDRL